MIELTKGCDNCYSHHPSDCAECIVSGEYVNWRSGKMDVVNDIGIPATLELCAEEAVELAHACLKYARKLRGENPTPKSEEDIMDALIEEVADIGVCVGKLLDCGIVPQKDVDAVIEYKTERWEERLKEKKRKMGK